MLGRLPHLSPVPWSLYGCCAVLLAAFVPAPFPARGSLACPEQMQKDTRDPCAIERRTRWFTSITFASTAVVLEQHLVLVMEADLRASDDKFFEIFDHTKPQYAAMD